MANTAIQLVQAPLDIKQTKIGAHYNPSAPSGHLPLHKGGLGKADMLDTRCTQSLPPRGRGTAIAVEGVCVTLGMC